MSNKSQKEHAIIVLGMHRSGTSAISGVLSKMNVFMGSDLYAAQKGVNEKGFFENSKVVDLNEEVFDLLFSSWDDPLGQQLDFAEKDALSRLRAKAVRLIKKEYSNKVLWGIKDPRISVLLPFWQSVFSQLSIKVSYIVMVRHPLEVCSSLQKRNQFSQAKSLMLWLNYTLSSLLFCKNHDCQVVLYDDLMSDPVECLANVVSLVDSCFFGDIGVASAFITKDLRNYQLSFDANSLGAGGEIISLANRLYENLCQTRINYVEVDIINKEYRAYIISIKGVLSEHLEQVKRSELVHKKLFFNAYNSLWWKVAWPIKTIELMLTRLLTADK